MTEPTLKALPSMPLYVRDWLAGRAVQTMTPEQQGAFMALLCHAWPSSEEDLADPCTLPDDDAELALLSGLRERWAEVGDKVREQFQETEDGRLRNPKQWGVYLGALARSAQSKGAGTKGAVSRWGKGEYPPEFDACWAAYPSRPGNSKKDALRQWTARVNAGATAEELLEGTRRYAAFITATDRVGSNYVKMAATFYGPGEHYKDEWAAPRSGGVDRTAAAARWDFYREHGFTSLAGAERWPDKVAPDVLAELRRVRPWEIAAASRSIDHAVAEVARRLTLKAA